MLKKQCDMPRIAIVVERECTEAHRHALRRFERSAPFQCSFYSNYSYGAYSCFPEILTWPTRIIDVDKMLCHCSDMLAVMYSTTAKALFLLAWLEKT